MQKQNMETSKNFRIKSMISWAYAPCCKDLKLLIWLAFIMSALGSGSAVKCYKCAVTEEKVYVGSTTVTTPMCSKFDESNDFVSDCPFSTMCLKTISSLQLQNGQIQETVTRGCAQQKDTTQIFKNREWQHHHSVQEVYEEGCEEFKENSLAGSVRTHCYCRGDLCNSAQSDSALCNKVMAVIVALTTLFV